MADNNHEHGYGDDALVSGSRSSQDDNEKASGDLEVAPSSSRGFKGKANPFGDETNADVKYRTMAWW